MKGKTWTGLATSEEKFADGFVGKRIQPFWIEDEPRKIGGTNFVVDQMFREFAVRDGLLVTGQQQYSGAAAARLVVEALGCCSLSSVGSLSMSAAPSRPCTSST